MAPNLFVAAQTLVTPRRWFKRSKRHLAFRTTEHWDSPIPGTYDFVPHDGWYLVELDSPDGKDYRLPRRVKFSHVLHRYMFHDEYLNRKKFAVIEDGSGKTRELGFFQLDNRVAWVNCWDSEGEFITGPYKLWCIDKHTGKFRDMLKGDDPEWQSRQSSRQNSVVAAQAVNIEDVGRPGLQAHRIGLVSNGSSPRSSVRGPLSPGGNASDFSATSFSPASSQPSTRPSSVRQFSEGEGCNTALTSPCFSRQNTLHDSTSDRIKAL